MGVLLMRIRILIAAPTIDFSDLKIELDRLK